MAWSAITSFQSCSSRVRGRKVLPPEEIHHLAESAHLVVATRRLGGLDDLADHRLEALGIRPSVDTQNRPLMDA
jgi:hypothetical protein